MISTRNSLLSVSKAVFQLNAKQICVSSVCHSKNSFKIQDLKDFDERVKNSKKPVIVDFFAS